MTKMTRTKLVVVRTNAKHARPKRLTDDELAEMIEEATVDAYGPSEQVSGFYTMLEEHLDLPFSTQVLGVDVVVERIDLTGSDEIVAILSRLCRRAAFIAAFVVCGVATSRAGWSTPVHAGICLRVLACAAACTRA